MYIPVRLKKKEFNKKNKRRRKRFYQRTPRRTRRSEPLSCWSTAIGDRQRWCGGLERRQWRGGLEQRRWWILSLSLTPILSLRLYVGFGLLWIFAVGLSDRRGLDIKIGSRDWKSAATAWWFGDQRQWWILSPSLIPILSFSHSDSLSQIGCGFWFWFEFFARSIRIVLVLFLFLFFF